MDNNPNPKASRGNIFKDSVLSMAEARGMEIIAQAGKNRADQLERAYQQCDAAEYDTIRAKLSQGNEQSIAAHAQAARRKLLLRRAELVDGLFAEVEQRLKDFTASEGYPAHLLAQLAKHAQLMAADKQVTVYLRAADAPHKQAIQAAYPGAAIQTDDHIRIGGLKVGDGRVLYDETLDQALEDQRRAFYHSGPLAL